jgi:hypothetical protein
MQREKKVSTHRSELETLCPRFLKLLETEILSSSTSLIYQVRLNVIGVGVGVAD